MQSSQNIHQYTVSILVAYGVQSDITIDTCLSAIKNHQGVSYICSPQELPKICQVIDQNIEALPFVNITWASFNQLCPYHVGSIITPLCSLGSLPSMPNDDLCIYYAFGPNSGSIIGKSLLKLGFPDDHKVNLDDGTQLSISSLVDGMLKTKWPVWVTVPPLPITKRHDLQGLVDIVAQLRSPNGCPWDREQDHMSLRACLTEEAAEVIEAINENDKVSLVEELGDVLLQVVLHAQLLSEESEYTILDIIGVLNDKLVRRHPHVFGDLQLADTQAVLINWDAIKSTEKADNETNESVLKKSKVSLPALAYAQDVSKRAARVGFEWQDFQGVLDKLEEEIRELLEAKQRNASDDIEDEVGDVLFTVVNLARHLGVDSEQALRKMVSRFRKRFEAMERMARSDKRELSSLDTDEWDVLWRNAKRQIEST